MNGPVAHGRAVELGTRRLAWELPHGVDDAVAGALVEGTVLAAYRFDRYRDPAGNEGMIPIKVKLTIVGNRAIYDFTGSHPTIGSI